MGQCAGQLGVLEPGPVSVRSIVHRIPVGQSSANSLQLTAKIIDLRKAIVGIVGAFEPPQWRGLILRMRHLLAFMSDLRRKTTYWCRMIS